MPDRRRPDLAEILSARRFWADERPLTPRPIYTLAGQVIGTPGNLATITAASKAGKSAVIAAMLAAGMGKPGRDYLGFESANPDKLAQLHFDSEQSPSDHWQLVDTALERAGLQEQPPWLYSYCLTGLDYATAWECVRLGVSRAAGERAGVHSVLLDGAADLVCNVNDPAEANGFVAELHAMAIRRECNIVSVIHFNPGTEKTRGHLGSQLERKAETNLRLDKDGDGVTVIWSDKQRRAPILKRKGPRFEWSDERGMHVSTRSLTEYRAAVERETLAEVLQGHFKNGNAHYAELIETLTKATKVKKRQSERKIERAVTLGLLVQTAPGLYKIRVKP